MPVKVVHINSVGDVTFCRSARSRRIRLTVSPGPGIRVSYPYGVALEEAIQFAEKQREWIVKQQQKLNASLPAYPEESEISTRYHQVILRRGGAKTKIKQTGFKIEILYQGDLSAGHPAVQEQTGKIMTEIYRWEARKYLPGRLQELAAQYQFRYNRMTIRDNRTNWGSCSGHNNISLNLHLMKLPDHLIDYILLHELAHTRVKNHGRQFWELLDTLTSNRARELSAEVRKHRVHSG